MNQVCIVGRIVDTPTIKETNKGKVSNITIAATRPFKNADGVYETDFFPVSIWNSLAENMVEYCKKGDLIGIKGNLFSKDHKINIVAEKVNFLATSKTKTDENIEIDKKI